MDLMELKLKIKYIVKVQTYYKPIFNNFNLSLYPKMSSVNNSSIRKSQPNKINQSQNQGGGSAELRILDYRNAKYQGIINPQTRKRQDIGILIDDQLTFILANWKNNYIEGPFFIAYPDQQILFGQIKNQQISSFLCCELPTQYTMYIDKINKIVVVDLHSSRNILTVRADIKNFTDSKFIDREFVKSRHFGEQNQKQRFFMEIIKQQKYENSADKYKIIQKNLNIKQIPDCYKNYKLFIDQFFLKSKKGSLIQVVQTKQDFSINFKKCNVTLMLKVLQKQNFIKLVGCANKLADNYQFYKKNNHSSNIVEQGIIKKGPVVIQYNLLPCNRPKNCETNLSHYHRQSITFINQFCNIRYVYNIKTICNNLQEEIKTVAMNKYAQILLQDVDKRSPKVERSAEKSRRLTPKDTIPDTFTLSQVKEDILKAVSKKKSKHSTHNASMYESPTKIIQPRQVFALTTNSKQDNIKSIYFEDNSKTDRILQSSRKQLNRKRNSPIKKMDNSFYKYEEGNKTLKKFHYLQEEEDVPNYSNQKYYEMNNIRRMAQDLERIKRQIKLSTPKSKKISPYRATNLSNKIYTEKKIDYFKQTPVRDSSKKRNISPLGSKKIFKYLPN